MKTTFVPRDFIAPAAAAARALAATVAMAIPIAALLLLPTPAAAQSSAPTGATLHRGLPVLVQWTPSFWPIPTVAIILDEFSRGGGSTFPNGPPMSVVSNNGQT